MGKYIDITGQRFGRLVALHKDSSYDGRHTRWICKCDCGNIKSIYKDSLLGNRTLSCGCLQKEIVSSMFTTHGKTNTRLYVIWSSMKLRCYNPNDPAYRTYGGRGITICDEWKMDFMSFHKWAYENGYDENAKRGECTLDRIDVNGNYCPENCRWVDQMTQMNNVSYNRYIEYDGIKYTVAEFARKCNLDYSRVYDLVIKRNISPYDVVSNFSK